MYLELNNNSILKTFLNKLPFKSIFNCFQILDFNTNRYHAINPIQGKSLNKSSKSCFIIHILFNLNFVYLVSFTLKHYYENLIDFNGKPININVLIL